MGVTPESLPENTVNDFRAPPPSPIASGRRSSVRNEEVLSEFLENSLKVPDLVLPNRVFPKQKSIQNPPKLDFQSLTLIENDEIMKLIDSIVQIGCLEVVNHGISNELIDSALLAGEGIFGVLPEKRKLAMRSSERLFGFEEIHGEEEKEISEEFVWCSDEELKKNMEGIWPMGYSNFSEKMEKLSIEIEEVGKKTLAFLVQKNPLQLHTTKETDYNHREYGSSSSSICYLHKHFAGPITEDELVNSLRYDVIRMLIRGSEFPHALCLHFCNGADEFHVYSKKGWVSFQPHSNTLLITIGDQLQTGSGGKYKYVMGRAIFKGVEQNHTSMAFLYSPPDMGTRNHNEYNISISQQIIFGIIMTLFYLLVLRFC